MERWRGAYGRGRGGCESAAHYLANTNQTNTTTPTGCGGKSQKPEALNPQPSTTTGRDGKSQDLGSRIEGGGVRGESSLFQGLDAPDATERARGPPCRLKTARTAAWKRPRTPSVAAPHARCNATVGRGTVARPARAPPSPPTAASWRRVFAQRHFAPYASNTSHTCFQRSRAAAPPPRPLHSRHAHRRLSPGHPSPPHQHQPCRRQLASSLQHSVEEEEARSVEKGGEWAREVCAEGGGRARELRAEGSPRRRQGDHPPQPLLLPRRPPLRRPSPPHLHAHQTTNPLTIAHTSQHPSARAIGSTSARTPAPPTLPRLLPSAAPPCSLLFRLL